MEVFIREGKLYCFDGSQIFPFNTLDGIDKTSGLDRRTWMTKLWDSCVTTTANAQARTDHIQTVLETPPALVRIGILNSADVPMTGVRVAIGAATLVGDDATAQTINPELANGEWKDCTFAQILRFTQSPTNATSGTLAAAWTGTTGVYSTTFVETMVDTSGRSTLVRQQRSVTLTNGSTAASWAIPVSASASAVVVASSGVIIPGNADFLSNNPNITWTEWTEYPNAGRNTEEPRGLTPIHVRVEVPASNTKVTVLRQTGTQAWETADNVLGRVYRMRTQTGVLGVTNKNAFNSTAFAAQCVPIAIQYIPRMAVRGYTAAVVGDSTSIGAGSSIPNFGYMQRAQCELSAPGNPIELAALGLLSV